MPLHHYQWYSLSRRLGQLLCRFFIWLHSHLLDMFYAGKLGPGIVYDSGTYSFSDVGCVLPLHSSQKRKNLYSQWLLRALAFTVSTSYDLSNTVLRQIPKRAHGSAI